MSRLQLDRGDVFRVTKQHSYGEDGKTPGTEDKNTLGFMPAMPRRASAFDVFSSQNAGNAGASPLLGRKHSFKAGPPDPATPPSPDTGLTFLVPDDDKPARRRGSQL